MSSTLPPGGPDHPAPPVDYLDSGPREAVERPGHARKGRRIGAVAGGGVVLAGLVGGGVWAWNFWFAQGPQPAEALPATTLAYVSIDLDPSGEQKVEAIRTLRKFPAFRDEVGLDTDDDVRKRIFDEIQDDANCAGLDFGDDIEPWLGDRFAFAIVDRGEQDPAPVVVVQVSDEDKAADGLDKIRACASDAGADDDFGGYAFNGDWAVLAENEEIAQAVVDEAQDHPLDDDSDYQKWTDAVGDPGIVNVYAAPEAGTALLDFFEGMPGFMFGASGYGMACSDEAVPAPTAPGGSVDDEGYQSYDENQDYLDDSGDCEMLPPAQAELPQEFRDVFENFPGAAATLRFDDGDVELEFATGQTDQSQLAVLEPGAGTEVLTTLPDTTAAALGAAFTEGWFDTVLDQMQPMFDSEDMTQEQALAILEQETGLTRSDMEALDGASFAVAFDSEVDPSAFDDEDITRVPLGVKIKGDSDAIVAALTKLKATVGSDLEALVWRTEGDYVIVSGSAAYLDVLAEDGDLGNDDAFQDLAPHADSALGALFVDFDANHWLDDVLAASGAPPEVTDNVEPLHGLGISAWIDDDEQHALVRLTTQ